MRTTVTLPDALVKEALATTGKLRLSDALTVSLTEYFRLRKRLELLDDLFDRSVPHRWRVIKSQRKGRKWSL